MSAEICSYLEVRTKNSYDTVYWNDANCNGLFTNTNGIFYGNG